MAAVQLSSVNTPCGWRRLLQEIAEVLEKEGSKEEAIMFYEQVRGPRREDAVPGLKWEGPRDLCTGAWLQHRL